VWLPLSARYDNIAVLKREKIFQGTHGFEPWTYRTAADCSTTELYPQHTTKTHCLAVDICTTDVVVAWYPFSWVGSSGIFAISASVV
jgi:hypothetical protein